LDAIFLAAKRRRKAAWSLTPPLTKHHRLYIKKEEGVICWQIVENGVWKSGGSGWCVPREDRKPYPMAEWEWAKCELALIIKEEFREIGVRIPATSSDARQFAEKGFWSPQNAQNEVSPRPQRACAVPEFPRPDNTNASREVRSAARRAFYSFLTPNVYRTISV
jgi:hypothetical protein